MNSLIAPAVVAAAISGIVTSIGIWISSRTSRAIHTEKIAFDREQAEKKASAEIELAERKFEIDRRFAAWKRRTEFAEQVLADFYQARDIINAARSPATYEGEGNSRKRSERESDADTKILNAYFAIIERLQKQSEFFSQLHSRRYRFLAYFGREASRPYDELHEIYVEVSVAVQMLLETYRKPNIGTLQQEKDEWRSVIWNRGTRDEIRSRLDAVIESMEAICSPAIHELRSFEIGRPPDKK